MKKDLDVLSLMRSYWSYPTKVENVAEEMIVKFCLRAQGILTVGHMLLLLFSHKPDNLWLPSPQSVIVPKPAMLLSPTLLKR